MRKPAFSIACLGDAHCLLSVLATSEKTDDSIPLPLSRIERGNFCGEPTIMDFAVHNAHWTAHAEDAPR
jgi:hypothetical protein